MSILKNTLLKILPRPVLAALKKVHYRRVIRNYQTTDWPYGPIAHLFVKRGDKVVDVGANVGYISGLLARWVGSRGSVHSFEPVPETFRLLDHNMQQLGLSQVVRHQCAASSSPGTVQMEIPHYDEGGENFYQSHIVENGEVPSGTRTVSVEKCRLDDIVSDDRESITFIKIDVEGHELDVIDGAVELLSAAHPALLIEVGGEPDEPGTQAHGLFSRLRRLGYGAWVLQNGRLRPRSPGDRPVDYFFLTEMQARHAASKGLCMSVEQSGVSHE